MTGLRMRGAAGVLTINGLYVEGLWGLNGPGPAVWPGPGWSAHTPTAAHISGKASDPPIGPQRARARPCRAALGRSLNLCLSVRTDSLHTARTLPRSQT